MSNIADRIFRALVIGALTGLAACSDLSTQSSRLIRKPGPLPSSNTKANGTAEGLRLDLAALDKSVREDEAERLANCAWNSSRKLAKEYNVLGPALFHNFLVNTGFKQRGLCYQWAEDLLAELQTLHLITLELHWGMARAGTFREHNCIVVTARQQPFVEGIVLDAWRHSGRLVWARVSTDRYPWEEGMLEDVPVTTNIPTMTLSVPPKIKSPSTAAPLNFQ